MRRIIDFHTHAFPDNVAGHAILALEKAGDVKAKHAGRVESLLAAMDAAGVEKSVLLTIATKPSQFQAILDWCTGVASERIIPFPSVHPEDSQAVDRIRQFVRLDSKE
jgi:predicted TIM-barrel fold metal-dependent hydrolase